MSIAAVQRVSYAVAGFGDTLTHDLAHAVPAAMNFFPTRSWTDVARQIDAHSYPRTELVRTLEQGAVKLNAPPPVLENIRQLGLPHTYVVATGQQAGFLGGPLYSLHKALTAIKLAAQLQAQAGGEARFVPVFWVASDDHDLPEIDHANFLAQNGDLIRVRAPLTPASAGCSASDAGLDEAQWETLRTQLNTLPDAATPAAAYLDLYRGRSLGDAFTALLLQWLGQFGLVVVQASELRGFGRELLLRELDEYDVTSRLIHEAGLSLARYGYKPGFSQFRAAPHFFITTEARVRAHLDPVLPGANEFRERAVAFEARGATPRTFSKVALRDLIRTRPELFSASAALRPVLQQQIFPVVAAVLGPGEIAYWAQLKAVHDHFGAVYPLVFPRATLTLLDVRGQKALRKLGLEPDSPELFLDYEALKKRGTNAELAAKLQTRSTHILNELKALETEVQAVSGGLQPLFDKARARISHELERIAEKSQAAVKSHEGAVQERVRYLAFLVRPRNAPQERVLACAQLLAQHPTLPQDLLNVIDPTVREHLVVTLA